MNKLTVPELSKQTGIERSLIWYWVKKLGIKGERISGQRILLLSPSEAEKIKMSCGKFRMENGEYCVADLAKELGTSKSTIWDILNKKLDMRYTGDAKSRAIFSEQTANAIREAYHGNDRKTDQ